MFCAVESKNNISPFPNRLSAPDIFKNLLLSDCEDNRNAILEVILR